MGSLTTKTPGDAANSSEQQRGGERRAIKNSYGTSSCWNCRAARPTCAASPYRTRPAEIAHAGGWPGQEPSDSASSAAQPPAPRPSARCPKPTLRWLFATGWLSITNPRGARQPSLATSPAARRCGDVATDHPTGRVVAFPRFEARGLRVRSRARSPGRRANP